jgi:hypothetical protein
MTGHAIIIHSPDHARAALAASVALGVPVCLRSPPSAAAYLGAAVFREMIAAAAADYPDATFTAVLDCGEDPGFALNALRHGIKVVRIRCPAEVRARIADIASQTGASLDDCEGPALDLLDQADAPETCRAWLAGQV